MSALREGEVRGDKMSPSGRARALGRLACVPLSEVSFLSGSVARLRVTPYREEDDSQVDDGHMTGVLDRCRTPPHRQRRTNATAADEPVSIDLRRLHRFVAAAEELNFRRTALARFSHRI